MAGADYCSCMRFPCCGRCIFRGSIFHHEKSATVEDEKQSSVSFGPLSSKSFG